jgi:hypothetical protein
VPRNQANAFKPVATNRLRDAHAALDAAVRAACGMTDTEDPLAFLPRRNLELAEEEAKGQPVITPGLPPWVPNPEDFISPDCIEAPP